MNDTSNLRDTIAPKSDQLNSDDLLGGISKTITITAVKRGNAEQPVDLHYEGDDGKPYKPCKSMRRVLITAWGDDGQQWVGRSMTLYCDPEVKFGGVKVGGIRISHLSHIDRPRDFSLTVTRAKKATYSVGVLNSNYPDDKFADNLPLWIDAIARGKTTVDQVIKRAGNVAPLTDEQVKQIRDEVDAIPAESVETPEESAA